MTDKRDPLWNADVNRTDLRKDVIEKSVKYQASAFAKAGNLYVPFYRQSHYKIYVSPYDKQEKGSRMIAYQDVKAAFEYYLEIIIKAVLLLSLRTVKAALCVGCYCKNFLMVLRYKNN